MNRLTRRILLYSTILFFIFIVPAVLFYAWGYSFDWEKKKPVMTGAIYLKSTPKKADIELDGKLKDKTPSYIKRLRPKEYQIKIIKDGFHSWQKKLRVESGFVTEAKNILLIPLNPYIEIIEENLTDDFSLEKFLSQEKTDDIFYIQKPSYILYRTDQVNSFQEQISLTPLPNTNEYEIFVSQNKRIAALSNDNELYSLNPETKNFEIINQDVKNAQFSNDSKKLLYFTSNEIWVYYLEDIAIQPNKKAGAKELITRLSQKIKQAVWHGKTNEHIIFSVGNQIKIIELDGRDERNTIDIFQSDTEQIGYNLKDDKLYFIKEGKLFAISLE